MTELEEHTHEEMLILKVLAGEADTNEVRVFHEKCNASESFRNFYIEMKETWESSQALVMVKDVNVDKAVSNFMERVGMADKKSKKGRYYLALATSIAATIALVFILSHTFWGNNNLKIITSDQIVVIVLPDSSRVHINKNSTFTYPKYFKGTTRKVALTGEAYFEIKENKAHPFVISAGGVFVKVWGTSFNVNSSSQMVSVSVNDGKVSVYPKSNEAKQIILAKGETGNYSAKDQTLLKQINPNQNDQAWATGIFTFNQTPLCEVAQILGRYYQTKITFQDQSLGNYRLTAVFDHQSMDSILEILESTFDIKAVKQDVIVLKKNDK